MQRIAISENVFMGNTPGIAELETDNGLIVGTERVTIILPEYLPVFKRGVLHIMQDIVRGDAGDTPRADGTVAHGASVFGFVTLVNEAVYWRDQPTEAFLPIAQRCFEHLLGDDPHVAVNNFHRRFVNQTNEVLDVLESPYFLTPLEPLNNISAA